jgi:hypothetical protein
MDDSLHPVVLAVSITAHFGNLLEDLPVRAAVPIAIGLRSHLVLVGDLAKSLFHGSLILSGGGWMGLEFEADAFGLLEDGDDFEQGRGGVPEERKTIFRRSPRDEACGGSAQDGV